MADLTANELALINAYVDARIERDKARDQCEKMLAALRQAAECLELLNSALEDAHATIALQRVELEDA